MLLHKQIIFLYLLLTFIEAFIHYKSEFGKKKYVSPSSLNAKGNNRQFFGRNMPDSTVKSKNLLYEIINKCQPNGIDASAELRLNITRRVEVLETKNPTKRPAYSNKMNGFWRLLYTDFSPASTSSGKLGPFIGKVYQDLDSNQAIIKNILDLSFPPIIGGLIAKQSIFDENTWAIEFDFISNKIAGIIPLPKKKFIPGDQIRLWKITYLDDNLRIMRARRVEADPSDSFIFILERDESTKLNINL